MMLAGGCQCIQSCQLQWQWETRCELCTVSTFVNTPDDEYNEEDNYIYFLLENLDCVSLLFVCTAMEMCEIFILLAVVICYHTCTIKQFDFKKTDEYVGRLKKSRCTQFVRIE